jgi:CheY-like chemotaxis protein
VNKSILIVEDELIIAKVYQLMLKSKGIEVCAIVSDGIQAIEKAKNHIPDLIVLDVQLARNTNGIDTAKEIRKFSQAPIIFTTGNAIHDTQKNIASISNACILGKPVDNIILYNKINELLN